MEIALCRAGLGPRLIASPVAGDPDPRGGGISERGGEQEGEEDVVDKYRVKVKRKQPTYLWGGDGINTKAPRKLDIPVLLNIRVDEIGETIRISYKTAEDPPTEDDFGELKPGETFTVSLQDLTAVRADCDFDTYVACNLYCPVIH